MNIIIDAKYYQNTLNERHGTQKLHPDNLFQMWAYLTNAQRAPDVNLSGMLVYPRVDQTLRCRYPGPRIDDRDDRPGAALGKYSCGTCGAVRMNKQRCKRPAARALSKRFRSPEPEQGPSDPRGQELAILKSEN